jgi:hypothetical protein
METSLKGATSRVNLTQREVESLKYPQRTIHAIFGMGGVAHSIRCESFGAQDKVSNIQATKGIGV